jgi:thioesterase domain-containing protein
LFLLHDGSGEVEGYVEFCRRLNEDIACWGIRAQRFEGYAPRNIGIREMAAAYVEKIKKIQPHGPYSLAGWSLGGTIAFEMALQLETIGEEVAFFALIDTMPPRKSTQQEFEFTLQSELKWLSEFLGEDAVMELSGKVKDLETLWQSVVNDLQEKNIDVGSLRRQVPPHVSRVIPNFDRLTLKELIYFYNVNRTFARAYDQYIPAGKLKTPIRFLAAGSANIEKEKEWQNYSIKPLNMIEIDADHFSILKMPQVVQVVEMFKMIKEEKS